MMSLSGLVIGTEPGAQEQIGKGETVKLIVSKGQRMETVPDVTGAQEADAVKILDDNGFEPGDQGLVYSRHRS